MAQQHDTTESLVVRLASEESQVNATAVSTTMSAVVALILEAQHQISENEQLLIKARPFAKGSFEIPLDLILVAAGSMLVSSPLIETILDILQKYFDIKRNLKGAEPPSATTSTITIDGNEVSIGAITLNLLSPTSIANQQMAAATEELEKDQAISGFELLRGDEREAFVSVARSEFRYYKSFPPTALPPNERDLRSREMLSIASIVFEGTGKWRFNRQGHIVATKIEDAEFLERVQTGIEVFGAGDRLDVALLIHQTLDPATNDYLNKSYIIERVYGHEKRQKQQSLLDN